MCVDVEGYGRRRVLGLAGSVCILAALLGLLCNFVLWIVLAVLLVEGVYLLSRRRRRIGKIIVEDLENVEELEKKLEEAREDFENIRRSMKQIEDAELREQSEQLHETAARILKYLEKHPEKNGRAEGCSDQIRKTGWSRWRNMWDTQRSV